MKINADFEDLNKQKVMQEIADRLIKDSSVPYILYVIAQILNCYVLYDYKHDEYTITDDWMHLI